MRPPCRVSLRLVKVPQLLFLHREGPGLARSLLPSIQLQNARPFAVQHLNMVTAFSESISSFFKRHNIGFLDNIRLMELAFGFIDTPCNTDRVSASYKKLPGQTILSATRRETHNPWMGQRPVTSTVCRHPCKSLSREKTLLLARATEERAKTNIFRIRSSQTCASRRWFLPSFAEPDIHLLSRAPKDRHRRLSLCSLPVPKHFEGSLGSICSFAQSANSRTWQPARCVIP